MAVILSVQMIGRDTSVDLVKRKGTTGKVEPSGKLLQEEKFSYQRKISRAVLDHDISLDLVNLNQTPLSYVLPSKYTFYLKGSTTVPIKGVDDNRQITATSTLSTTGVFLPIQLIY